MLRQRLTVAIALISLVGMVVLSVSVLWPWTIDHMGGGSRCR